MYNCSPTEIHQLRNVPDFANRQIGLTKAFNKLNQKTELKEYFERTERINKRNLNAFKTCVRPTKTLN
jgi:hypothetical protein